MRADCPTVVVTSGKGGVGKSTISGLLAFSLAQGNLREALLDGDVRQPNLPSALRLNGRSPEVVNGVPFPLYIDLGGKNVPMFSSAYIFRRGRGIKMEGHVVKSILTEMLHTVQWPEVDVLVVDMDPSPGDTLVALKDSLRKVGAIVVAEADPSAVSDCERMVDALQEMDAEVIGMVGNELGKAGAEFINEDMGEVMKLANRCKVRYLGSQVFDKLFMRDPMKAYATVGAMFGQKLRWAVEDWVK